MRSELRTLAKEVVIGRLLQNEDKSFGILKHRQDVHCIVYHLLIVAGYAVAFYIYLHPAVAHIHSTAELLAFLIPANLLLGWATGIDLGLNFHNHVHRHLFRVAWLNRWFGRLWAVTGGWPARLWFHAHVTVHHADTLGPTDWTVPRRRSDGSFESRLKYSALHWPWRYVFHLWRDYRSDKYPRLRREAPTEVAIFAALYSIPFWIDPMMGLLLWFLPHYVANTFILGTGMYVQHVGCEQEDDVHPFRTSNTYFSGFYNLVTFNSGYHNLHHLFPHVHWSDLPEFQSLLQQPFDSDGASALRIGMFRANVELALGKSWPSILDQFPQRPLARGAAAPPDPPRAVSAGV
jgi:fatty acid desaturase